jgi:hypothetical protein
MFRVLLGVVPTFTANVNCTDESGSTLTHSLSLSLYLTPSNPRSAASVDVTRQETATVGVLEVLVVGGRNGM